MTTSPVAAVKQRPTAIIGTLVTAGITAGAELVDHHVISQDVADTYGPWALLALVAGGFLLTWFHVVPAAKVEQLAAELEGGRLPDADVARLVAGVGDMLHASGLTHWLEDELTGADHPDAQPGAHPDAAAVEPAAGMSAGAGQAELGPAASGSHAAP